MSPDRSGMVPLRRAPWDAATTWGMCRQQWRDWVSPDIGYINVCPDVPFRPTVQPLAS
jgi:hypothetical protein